MLQPGAVDPVSGNEQGYCTQAVNWLATPNLAFCGMMSLRINVISKKQNSVLYLKMVVSFKKYLKAELLESAKITEKKSLKIKNNLLSLTSSQCSVI